MNTQKRLNYEEPVPAGITAGSVLLILSCLGLVTLRAVIGDRISDRKDETINNPGIRCA